LLALIAISAANAVKAVRRDSGTINAIAIASQNVGV
jgi:hypothetical protein